MKFETTPLDDVCIGVVTVAVLYLVMRTISTLERISKKVDHIVDHIGEEVDSAVTRLTKEAAIILHNLEKNAFNYGDHIFQNVQNVELQCHRSKHAMVAFSFAPKPLKKKSSSHQHHLATENAALQQSHPSSAAAAAAACAAAAGAPKAAKHQHQHQLLALHRCVDRVLKCRYHWPFNHISHKRKPSSRIQAPAAPTTTTPAVTAH